jgi:hypothetical protein
LGDLTFRGGCIALALELRVIAWLAKFWASLLEKYDGSINPIKFLQMYITTMRLASGNEVIMENYFSVALTGSLQSWLMTPPPPDSIPS